MEIWFLKNMKRLLQERGAIQNLEESVHWLKGLDWVIDNSSLCVDSIIEIDDNEYEIRLTYPALFPSAPPSVRPKSSEEHWSTHQYQDGTLCLEWGHDNWHPDLTGRHILESTYKLLSIENPKAANKHHVAAPSRHNLSLGQELRGKFARFLYGSDLESYVKELPTPIKGSIEFSIQWQSKSLLVLIQTIKPKKMPAWEDPSIPKGVRATEEGSVEQGVLFTTKLSPNEIGEICNMADVRNLIGKLDEEVSNITPKQTFYGILFIDADDTPHFFLIWQPSQDKEERIYRLAPIIHSKDSTQSRTPKNLQGLCGKSVGIVGLGSVGSRLAISLARMGVSHFFLVDDDVILPHNVCRHILDWQNVGEHKVDAIAQVLHRITPRLEVEVSRLNLTRQESTTGLSLALDKLGRTDLLIDATADPKVFNLMAAVAKTYNKPLLWSQVYDGGIGGLIARSRPEHDPDPHTMRAAYNYYTANAPTPDLKTGSNYAGEDEDGNIFSASDADVGVIAYHAARLAVDTLLGYSPSMFPYSMYLIGLQKSWIFDQPFDTIPIESDQLTMRDSPDSLNDEEIAGFKEFLAGVLKKKSNEDSTSE